MRLLVTGATGKVGQAFLRQFLATERFSDWSIVALCNNREVDLPRVEVVKGSLSEREVAAAAMRNVTHVVHLAAVKETPELAMDVSVKGLFWLLEEMRLSATARQFILMGGDCSVGHIIKQYDAPITENSPRRAYPGCYALSKVLEEEMLVQFQIQYDINGCCLRAPWIMDKDDFRYALSFGDEQFGGPAWTEFMSESQSRQLAAEEKVPLMLDIDGAPLIRNFLHVSDVVRAIMLALDAPAARQQLFNLSMDEPVNYARVAEYLKQTRNLDSVELKTPYFGNWLDSAKIRQKLGWRPEYDFERLIEEAWTYQRGADDKRVVWYPG